METKYFKNNEFDYEVCKRDARNGVPEAQILFGDYLQYGETNAQNWLEQHQMMLGDYFNMYKHDTEEAKFWYKMAADAGNEYAMIKLARCYHYKENPDIEPLLITPMKFYYSLPNFNQITEKKYEISNFTVLPFEFIDEKTLLYGRMPEKINEIVVEKWVLESAITESAVSNFLDITSFINRPVGFKNQDASYKIVGIVDSKYTRYR